MEELDFTLQDAGNLLQVSEKYPATDSQDGISAEDTQELRQGLEDVSTKDTLQKRAVEEVGRLTDLQNQSMASSLEIVRKIHNAAKSVYGSDNKPMMKLFHVGGRPLTTVKAMTSELKYMKATATERKAELANGGLKDADIVSVDSTLAELSGADNKQEDAKKVQKAATATREKSMKNLQKVMRRIRHKAKVVFQKRPDVLVEFEPIRQGRTSSRTQKTAATQPPPA